MRNAFLAILGLMITFVACTPDSPIHSPDDPAYTTATFSTTPVNLGDINSQYDDYNSTSPILGTTFPLVFSSNRNSSGKNFDFVYKLVDALAKKSDGVIQVGESTAGGNMDIAGGNANIGQALTKVNSAFDEMGPYLFSKGTGPIQTVGAFPFRIQTYLLLYATNEPGNLDIRFTENVTTGTYTDPRDLAFLNSSKDDAYPCLTRDSSSIYFCSNRDGNFDIFKAGLASLGKGIITVLQDATVKQVTKDADVSSAYDDKCPFIMGNLMVFTSNRPGGYGGFDLYYSKLVNGKWSAPVNFGDTINTPNDEYRPIVLQTGDMTNDFMLFSSNRPGGKGGFDLYYVGIDKMRN